MTIKDLYRGQVTESGCTKKRLRKKPTDRPRLQRSQREMDDAERALRTDK